MREIEAEDDVPALSGVNNAGLVEAENHAEASNPVEFLSGVNNAGLVEAGSLCTGSRRRG